MRQRLGIACVLTGSPQTLLLDEPTLGLDPVQRSRLRELLAELSQRMRIVVSTHAVDDIADIAQRIVVLGHRRVLYSGPVGELRTPGSSLEAAYVNLVTAS